MKRSALLIHAGWAVVVLLVFIWGSQRRLPGAGDSSAGEAAAADVAGGRTVGGTVGRDSPARPRERGARKTEGRGDGLIARLFGARPVAGGDLRLLAEEAVRDPNPITRRLAFTRLLESLTPENALEVRDQLVALGIGDGEWRDFNYSWGALAGEEAFLHAVSSEERDMEAVLTGWAAARPAEALALLDKLPENLAGQRDKLAASVVSGLADHDRSLATEVALRYAGEEFGGNLMRIVAGESLLADGPELAARWSESLPDGPQKAVAMDRIAGGYVREDPEAAARWVERFAGEEYAVRAVAEVGEEWAERDPVAAVGWLEGLPAGEGQKTGLSGAFGDWEDTDPEAAAKYMLGMRESPQRDAAISGFARGYAWQDPETAIAWAEDISDPGLRQQSLTRAGQAYFRRDPESARAWLEVSGLPAEAQQAVLNPPRRR